MARYPGVENERRFGRRDLCAAVASIFRACGMSAADADLVADSLVAADRRGIHSHGVLRVADYVKKLQAEGVDPRGAPALVSRAGGALVVDGGNSLGQVAGVFAMDQAIAAAREVQVAFGAVRNSNHCGALDYYTLRAAGQGMIGIAGTNALPTMAPWGGVDKIVGLNPLSVAMPVAGRAPLVLDVALGATAHGKIRVFAQKGEPIPDGWAFDADGRPTTDAQAALDGLIQPIGAFKGIGLAMIVGLMSTLLSGAGYGLESGNMTDDAFAGRDGQFYLALNIAGFEDPDRFATRLAGIVADFEASRRAPGVERIYVPGSLEADIAARHDAEGIPLNAETLRSLVAAADACGADAALFATDVP